MDNNLTSNVHLMAPDRQRLATRVWAWIHLCHLFPSLVVAATGRSLTVLSANADATAMTSALARPELLGFGQLAGLICMLAASPWHPL